MEAVPKRKRRKQGTEAIEVSGAGPLSMSWAYGNRMFDYVHVELSHKAGKVVVLEVLGQDIPGELHDIAHNE